MTTLTLPEDIAARLHRPMPWWKLMDCTDLSGSDLITRQASGFAQKLAKFKVAVVPDPRIDFGGVTGDTLCVALKISVCNRHVTSDYSAALQQLQRDLAFLSIKGRPSPRELNWIRAKGFEYFKLDSESRERLMAWLELIMQEPLDTPELLVRAPSPKSGGFWRGNQTDRYRALCESDGVLDELEQEALKLVGAGDTGHSKRQLSIFDEPVISDRVASPVNLSNRPNTLEFRTSPSPKKSLALLLDEDRILDISQQTSAVSNLLNTVFEAEEEVLAPCEAKLVNSTGSATSAPPWKQALQLLSSEKLINASEFIATCTSHGWLGQALIDDLNDRGLDLTGELLLDGDTEFEVNPMVLQALISL